MTLPAILGQIVDMLERTGVSYMITGSIASSIHGEPRATRDVDVVIDPEPDELERLIEDLGRASLYVDVDAARTALHERGQFNAIDGTTGWKVDFVVRKERPFSRTEFARRQRADLLGRSTWVASPEDMIVAKLDWATATDSDRQLSDVAAMVAVGQGALDIAYIERWVADLDLREGWARVQVPPDATKP